MTRISFAPLSLTIMMMVLAAAVYPHEQEKDKKHIISTKETRALTEEKSDVVLLDVRTAEEYNSNTGHLKNAILIPVQELEQRVGELEKYKNQTIIAYCRTGRRSGTATELLTKKGFKIMNMEGGIVKWNEESFPIETESLPESKTGTSSIVSTEWLAEQLPKGSIVLLHVGERGEYDSEHIPGAQYIAISEISTPRGEGLTLELPPVARLDSVFESKGISDDYSIVVYWGNDWLSPTTRVYLTLDYLGFGERTYVLDGGMPAWRKEGRPLTREIGTPQKGSLTPHPREEIVVNADWVKSRLHQPNVAIVDSRSEEFYTGVKPGMNQRPGHIPGAASIPFSTVVEENGKFKTVEALKDLFLAAGVSPERQVVTYCHIGQQATFVYFVAKNLGYDVHLYDGSFEDWSKRSELPVETSLTK
ncbi:MAG TPA: rhodanese-like domain-containing protein [Bacteroidota bacterium]|nr:rhodanese-like domain-containing protein [Bacteroidota bacterium]